MIRRLGGLAVWLLVIWLVASSGGRAQFNGCPAGFCAPRSVAAGSCAGVLDLSTGCAQLVAVGGLF